MDKPTNPSSAKEEFLKKEYDKLNEEISRIMKEIHTRERYVLTILGVISAWIFNELANRDNLLEYKKIIILTRAISGVVFIILLLLGTSVYFLYKELKLKGTYLEKMEEYFLCEEKEPFKFGWEKYFKEHDKNELKLTLGFLFWILCLLLIIGLNFIPYFLDSQPK